MRTFARTAAVFGLVGSVAWTPGASAQSTEYRMDGSGAWAQVAAPQPGTDDAVIATARKALAEDRPEQAKTILDDWLTRNERSGSPLLPEAYVMRGDAQVAMGDEWNSLYDYERVIKQYAGSDQYVIAVERELDIGVRYVNGLRKRFLGFRLLPNEEVGEELLIRVQERLPGSRLAERAGIELADYYYNSRQLELAALAYELFVDNYPNSQYAMRARQRRIYAIIGRYKGPRYDGSSLLDSKILIGRFSSLYPSEAQAAGLDDGLVVRLDESSALEMLEAAKWYDTRGDEVSARFAYRRIVREHPQTSAAATALDVLQTRGWPVEDPVAAERRAARAKRERVEAELLKSKQQEASGAAGRAKGGANGGARGAMPEGRGVPAIGGEAQPPKPGADKATTSEERGKP